MAIFASSMSIFITSWQKDFGWSRGEILFTGYASIVVALLAPILGRSIDRIGVKPVIVYGILLSSASYFGLAFMSESIWVYYGLYLLLSFGGLATGGISYSNVISRVFVRSRGISLAFVRSGVVFGSSVAPILIFYMISNHGWRAALVMLSLILVCVGLPAVWFWMRSPRLAETVVNRRAEPGHARQRVITEPKFLRLAAGTALNYAPVFVLLSQLHPMLVAKGLDDAVSAGLIGALGVTALVGGWVTGFLIDRIWAPAISAVFSVGAAIGCVILLFAPPSFPVIFVAIALIGNAYGAEHDMAPFLVAKYFGVRRFSSVYGAIFLVFTIATSGLVWWSGIVFDMTNEYTWPITVSALCFAGAAACHLLLGPYPMSPDEADSASGDPTSLDNRRDTTDPEGGSKQGLAI